LAGIADTTASRTREHASRSDQKLAAGWDGRVQADAICSVAVDLKVSELADVPNVVVSASCRSTPSGRPRPGLLFEFRGLG
jgi:acetamidase/formamidase